MSNAGAPNGTLYRDLREAISNRQAIIVVGAGASIAACGSAREASWKGLLESGIDRCLELNLLDFPEAENLRRLLDSERSVIKRASQ